MVEKYKARLDKMNEIINKKLLRMHQINHFY